MPLGSARHQGAARICERGYALFAAVVAVALVSLATLVPLQNARHEAQRERETELLFVGSQYRDAVIRYYEATSQATPGAVKQYPASLDDLLADNRFPQPRRHLRRLYADPMTGRADWELVRVQGRIVGLHSRSQRAPLKRARFARELAQFGEAKQYGDWQFVATAVVGTAVVATAQPVDGAGPENPGVIDPQPPTTSSPVGPASPAAPGPTDPRLSECAAQHVARLAACNALPFGSVERRDCTVASAREYATCLRGKN